MKKPTAKAAKTPSPAPKVTAKSDKKATPAVKRASAAKTSAAKAPAVKASPAKLPATVIDALVDIGFGNTLYLRGEGPGLTWDVGVPLDCVADDKWTIALPGTGKSVVYKFLINDVTWSVGPDYVTESGAKATVEPTF